MLIDYKTILHLYQCYKIFSKVSNNAMENTHILNKSETPSLSFFKENQSTAPRDQTWICTVHNRGIALTVDCVTF